MARKKKGDLSAFSNALSDLGMNNVEFGESVVDLSQAEYVQEEGADIENLDDKEPEPADTKQTEDNTDPFEDNSQIPEEVLNNINNNNSSQQNNVEEQVEENEPEEIEESEEINENETANVGAFFDAFAEALHWDVDEQDKPTNVDDLIEYIQDVVDQNSVPEYADERVQQLDNYIKNGGKFEDFYNNMSQTISYDSLDMDDELNQKAVVRDYMKMQGYDDEQISRKIERYEDADMLEEEAQDAVVRLKQITQQQLALQQQQQEQIRQAQEEQARQFITSLNSSISSLDNIRGIAIPKEDRKALLDYITRTDANGLTQYQKDFNSNLVNNLIESAYFTMKGDALLGTAKRNGQTSAASKLRTMLRHQTKNHTSYNANDKQRSVAEMASSIWR